MSYIQSELPDSEATEAVRAYRPLELWTTSFESYSINNQNRNFKNLFEYDFEAIAQPNRHFYWEIEGY